MRNRYSLISLPYLSAYLSLLLTGAIFGFFYAWVCSTMWGLDSADPRVAIAAMQAMNNAVRNAVFFPAFFLTPAALGLSGLLAWRAGRRPAAGWFFAAGLVYFGGGLLLTAAVNVPMNEALAVVPVPDSLDAAGEIWQAYSAPWQHWNITRTVFSGISMLFAAIGLASLPQQPDGSHACANASR